MSDPLHATTRALLLAMATGGAPIASREFAAWRDAGYPDAHPPRFVCGFEVTKDWTMPKPPIPGCLPYVEFHGGDGLSLFWHHPDWSKWPSSGAAFRISTGLGWTFDTHNCVDSYMDTEPLVQPDTGGAGYKRCLEAFAQLGFEEA